MAITSNLYPPILPDMMPAFVRNGNQPCRIYFSLSSYNSIKDIKNVQVSLINQQTNISAFNALNYPLGIKIFDSSQIAIDSTVSDSYNYYVEFLKKDNLEGDEFALNQYYKVQLRFTSNQLSDVPEDAEKNATWFYSKTQYFSEWSKVCLIKGIEKPEIFIRDLTQQSQQGAEITLTSPIVSIIGNLYYENKAETEYLKSYNIKIYQDDNPNLIIAESGQIYSNKYNPNEFNYQLPYTLQDGINYTLIFSYITNNGYKDSETYNFRIIQHGIDTLNANINAIADEENGRIKINIISSNLQPFMGNITIRRTSSKSNFHKWEDVKTIAYTTRTQLNYTWYDNTIESGVWYKYCAQKRDTLGNRGPIIGPTDPIMCIFDHMFLTKENCQLKIAFNPTISEFKYNVNESQQVTLGSKFPYVKRNGHNYFRTFSIGGLISSLVDMTDWYDPHYYDGQFHNNENENKMFASKNQILYNKDTVSNNEDLYKQYNQQNNITEYNDYIYEREFRNKVYEFLYNHDVKLFRSTTQGNILVKLMNVTFQPMDSLGRRLYSFTATAVQIDDISIANYDKYKIQTLGTYAKQISQTCENLGELTGKFSKEDGNILNLIGDKYKKSTESGFVNKVQNLRQLKIEIESPPSIIIQKNNGELDFANKDTTDFSTAINGYIIYINNVPMVIKAREIRRPIADFENGITDKETKYLGIFEIKEEDNIIISDVKFPYSADNPIETRINYTVTLEQAEDTSGLFRKMFYQEKIGQLYGTFNVGQSVMQKIYNKYLFKTDDEYQQLINVNSIGIESLPGTVVYIKDSEDNDFDRHILQNGYLQLNEDDITIKDFYFNGVHLYKREANFLNPNGITEFTNDQGVYNSFDQIVNLTNKVNGGVYTVRTYGLSDPTKYILHQEVENTLVYSILELKDKDLLQGPWTDTPSEGEGTPFLYTLFLNAIENDISLKFVYYYGCWYVYQEAKNKANSLSKGDYRHIYEDEFVEIDLGHLYSSFDQIENPVTNGVYRVNLAPTNSIPAVDTTEDLGAGVENFADLDDETKLLILTENHVIYKADQNYSLILRLLAQFDNKYIYYHNQWCLFTQDNDVICPINGLVDYECEIMKGEFYKDA